ncbi:lactoylglutathione lyase [Chitinophagaceae bacterium IBVUCB1]|nr:lactoylglutathione lyase [Chitinophagaceae bacterium IBVUCB1]
MKMIASVECILYAADQKNSRDFYVSILGREPILDVQGMTSFELCANTRLGLMPETGIAKIITPAMPHPSTGNGIPRCELYIYVSEINKTYSRIQSLGIPIISSLQTRDWGDKAFYFADPDGHIIAFAEKIST